jgi:hypothetical protein
MAKVTERVSRHNARLTEKTWSEWMESCGFHHMGFVV